jgi:4-diphosphocytidyl-2-C-methyl-D-erythritol kinase
MPRVVKTLAPAKLNLALSVGPPLPVDDNEGRGGMHPICSWMVTVDLFDELLLTQLEHGRLSRYAILWHEEAKRRSDINWSISKDLAVRAHLALEQRVGRPLPLQMKLEKRIPVGGGLGGGSANAAAMLRGVNELFDLGLSIDDLQRIGATLGSDVPFLVQGGSAVVEGMGDELTPHPPPQPQMHAVIGFPNAICPTGRIYGLFDQQVKSPELQTHRVHALAQSAIALSPDSLFNDLAPAAIAAAPALRDALDELSGLAERTAHVTGSGSSLFVICDNGMHAAALAEAVERQMEMPAVAVQTTTHCG